MDRFRRGSLLVFAALAAAVAASGQAAPETPGVPRIAVLPATKMLVVEAKGDPAVTAGPAFTKLFSSFFRIPGARMAPPRARWTGDRGRAPRAEWVGLFGLPLPESVTSLPAGLEGVRIETWPYGTVAEVLYVGPYENEAPTIRALHAFIEAQGYEIAGPHEEEYLNGPGTAASPADYRTVIRYEVRKR